MQENSTLLEILKPLSWLEGTWEGKGTGSFPTIAPFLFFDKMTFKLLPDAFASEPLMHYEEIAWLYDDEGRKFKHWETGFFRPLNNGSIEFHVIHNSGRAELMTGAFDYIEKDRSEFRISFTASDIRNAVGLTKAISSKKVFDLTAGVLKYTHAMSTEDVPLVTPHLSLELTRIR